MVELKDMHSGQYDYTDPQYRLWARMIINGIHSSKDTPPQVPMITGVTPTRTRKSVEDKVVSTVTAVI